MTLLRAVSCDHFAAVVSCLMLVIVLTDACIHDDIQPSPVLQQTVPSTDAKLFSKRNRRTADLVYQPIRIQPVFSDLEKELTEDERQKLKNVVTDAVNNIKHLLSVVPVSGLLLLARSCKKSWVDGPNKGRCARVGKIPGEFCLDQFQIPDEHLGQLYLWNYTHPHPIKKDYEEGRGLAHTDYVLYTRALTTRRCLSMTEPVIAYAAYCQLDQHDRPIAGYVNFCPLALKAHFSVQKFFLTAVHELFHALGFSKELFNKYRDCSHSVNRVDCPTWPAPVLRNFGGSLRLVTPAVVRESQKHFGCSQSDFGSAVEVEGGKVGSHWDARFLQGSIMAPVIGLPHLTFVDPITLAVFEDMGWYKVHYNQADVYYWGRGEGCSFGLAPACGNHSDFYCNERKNVCHYLHLDKATCDTGDTLDHCDVPVSKPGGECFLAENAGNKVEMAEHGESYSKQSGCFLSDITMHEHSVTYIAQRNSSLVELAGRCYRYRCADFQELQVKVGESEWIPCPYNSAIQVPGYTGLLQCPAYPSILCPLAATTSVHGISSTAGVQQTSTVRPSISGVIQVEVTFPRPSFEWLQQSFQVETFRRSVNRNVLNITTLPAARLTKFNVRGKGSASLVTFDLHPSQNRLHDGPSSDAVYKLLQQKIRGGNFTVSLPIRGEFELYSASAVRLIKPETTSSSPKPKSKTPVLAGLFSVFVIVCVVIVVIVMTNKYHIGKVASDFRSLSFLPSSINPWSRRKTSGGSGSSDNDQNVSEAGPSRLYSSCSGQDASNLTEAKTQSLGIELQQTGLHRPCGSERVKGIKSLELRCTSSVP